MVLTGILAAAHTDGVPDPELGGGGLEAPRWEPVEGGSSRRRSLIEGRLSPRYGHRSAGQRQPGRRHRPHQRHQSRQRTAGDVGREGTDQGVRVNGSSGLLADCGRVKPSPSPTRNRTPFGQEYRPKTKAVQGSALGVRIP